MIAMTPKHSQSWIERHIHRYQNHKNHSNRHVHIHSSLNSIYLINNHIHNPTSQHHHPDKLLITAIVHQIYWTPHLIHIHKVRAHTDIRGNEIADTLANEGATKEKPTNTPHIHIAHATPYWLASYPIATRDGAITNIHKFIIKEHDNREKAIAQRKFPYVEKWLINEKINKKLSNHFWKNKTITDAQITQTLKFRFAQYMGNHRKNIFWPLKFQNPNCTLCHKNDRDTWPHLLSMCKHPYLKGLRIAHHNKAVHLIIQTLQANKYTRYYTLTNACNNNNTRQEQTIPYWLINCTCPQMNRQCQAKLRPDVLCVLGAPNHTSTPLLPSHTHTIQFIKFTYCHDRVLEQALTQKHAKYDPLIHTIWSKGWKSNPLTTITARVCRFLKYKEDRLELVFGGSYCQLEFFFLKFKCTPLD